MTNALRVGLIGGGLLAASLSQAVTINFIWTGSYTPGATVSSLGAAGQTIYNLAPSTVNITAVSYNYTEAAPGIGNAVGTGLLYTALSAVNPTFSFTLTGNNTAGGLNATVNLTGLLGPYAGVYQSGQLSHTDYFNPSALNGNTAGGQFSSVPEPASFAILGAGIVGLIRRRANAPK